MTDSRRQFLKKFAALSVPLIPAAGLAIAGNRTKYADDKILKVAILGLGSYGTRVADAMQTCTRAKLVGAISGTPAKLNEWQKKYNIPAQNCYNYSNMDDIKNNPNIDAVYVITPNATHKPFVIRVANAGKHAICEKPMAVNAAEGRDMIAACNKAGVQLLVGYRLHFEPYTLKVINMRKAGDFGKIMFFQGLSGFTIGDPKQWRLNPALSGGGAMMDIGIYSINGARYMVGEEPFWVTAQETKTDPVKFKPGIDETIQFQFGFPGGAVASCLSTYNMNNLDKFYLNGTSGFAEMQPSTGYGPLKGRTHKGELTEPVVTHQTLQMDGMAEIILDGKQPVVPVDGLEALKDLVIIDAIYKAIKTGGKVDLAV